MCVKGSLKSYILKCGDVRSDNEVRRGGAGRWKMRGGERVGEKQRDQRRGGERGEDG